MYSRNAIKKPIPQENRFVILLQAQALQQPLSELDEAGEVFVVRMNDG